VETSALLSGAGAGATAAGLTFGVVSWQREDCAQSPQTGRRRKKSRRCRKPARRANERCSGSAMGSFPNSGLLSPAENESATRPRILPVARLYAPCNFSVNAFPGTSLIYLTGGEIPRGSTHPGFPGAAGCSDRHTASPPGNKSPPANTSDPLRGIFLPYARRVAPAVAARHLYDRRNIPLPRFVQSIVLAVFRVSASSAFQAAPRKIITAEICIQISKPITAANPPYTRL